MTDFNEIDSIWPVQFPVTPDEMQAMIQEGADNGSINLEMICNELKRIKDELEVIDEKKKALTKVEDDLTKILVSKMKAEGLTSLKGEFGSATYSLKAYHSISEWNNFVEYIKLSGHFELFQRRISETACKEISERTGIKIPGLTVFEKDAIIFRRNKTNKP